MPHHKSAKKRLEKSRKERLINRAIKSKIKTTLKKYKELVQEGKTEDATKMLSVVYSVIDKAAKKNVFHKNKAANLKSKIAKFSK